MGVNALTQNWKNYVSSKKDLVWCFPPFNLVAQAVNKIKSEKINTVLIVPAGAKPWTPLIKQLPVRRKFSLPDLKVCCELGSQVPAYMHRPSFRIYLRAIFLVYNQQVPLTNL